MTSTQYGNRIASTAWLRTYVIFVSRAENHKVRHFLLWGVEYFVYHLWLGCAEQMRQDIGPSSTVTDLHTGDSGVGGLDAYYSSQERYTVRVDLV